MATRSQPKPSRPLKVGLVLDDSLDSTDGVQQYVITVGEWLRTQGHDVHYLVGQTSRTDLPNIHSLSRTVRMRFNGNRMGMPLPASRRRIRQLLTSEKFDILHVQVPYSPLMAGRIIAAAGPKTAVIGSFHVLPFSRLASMASYLLAWWCHGTLKRFYTVFGDTDATLRFAKKVYGVGDVVLPNMFPLRHFAGAHPFARKDNILNITFLNRLMPRKGCQTLLEAVRLLRAEPGIPDFKVTICGKGPLAESLQSFVRDNQMDDMVTFTGFVSEADKPRYLASSDITVFPSSGGESFGIVLLEAMASGRAAVLAGDNPGYRWVMNGNEELIFPATDARILAERLKQLLRDRPMRLQAAAWGQQHVRQFDVQALGPRIISYYLRALAALPTPKNLP